MAVHGHLKSSPVQQHPGKSLVRTILDSFEVPGSRGVHRCLVYEPLGMTFTDVRNLLPSVGMDQRMLQHALQLLLLALDYLHKNNVVHTDISPNNILCGVEDMSPFEQLELAEQEHPAARKILDDRTIYLSRQMPTTHASLFCQILDRPSSDKNFPRRYYAPRLSSARGDL